MRKYGSTYYTKTKCPELSITQNVGISNTNDCNTDNVVDNVPLNASKQKY